jgi:hypothetical protein
MKNNYICPKCKKNLMPGDHIVFSVKTEEGKMGLVLISPEIGNYTILHNQESTGFKEGEKLKVYCPICFERLGVDSINENLAMINVVDEEGNVSELYFSKILGEKATYKVSGNKVDYFGDDAPNYNFWGA